MGLKTGRTGLAGEDGTSVGCGATGAGWRGVFRGGCGQDARFSEKKKLLFAHRDPATAFRLRRERISLQGTDAG